MKIFGTISELVKVAFRLSGGKEVRLEVSATQSGSGPVVVTIPNVGSNAANLVTTGDSGTITSTMIQDGTIVNDDISLTAAIADTKLATISTAGKVSNAATTATDANNPSTIVARDSSGNFLAGTITATLSGNATNVTGIVAGANGGTGVANTGKTVTLGGNLTTSGAFATTLNVTNTTSVTLPTAGTLATLSGSETLLNKAISSTAALTGALQLPAGNDTTDKSAITPADGMIRYNTTNGAFEGRAGGNWSSIGGGGTTDTFTQASPVLAVGDVVYLNGSVYTKAIATSAAAAEVIGVISRDPATLGANKYEITLSGEVAGLSGLIAGEMYFLSPSSAGGITTTEPSVIGQVSVPVGVASSTTSLYVAPKRGVVVGGSNARTQLNLLNVTTSQPIQTVNTYEAGELAGWVYINASTPKRFYVAAQFSQNGAANNYNLSYQTSGDVPPTGFSMSITNIGGIELTLTSSALAGFSTAKINYSLNAPAVGATFPLAIDAGLVTTGTVAAARLPVVVPGTSAGVVAAAGLPGNTTGTAIAAGYVGERVFSQSNTASVALGTGIRGVGTLSIPSAGLWRIDTQLFVPWSGAAGGSSIVLSTVSATSSSFPQHGMSTAGFTDFSLLTTSGNEKAGVIAGVIATFTGAATIYVNAYSQNSVSATNAYYTIVAVRIA